MRRPLQARVRRPEPSACSRLLTMLFEWDPAKAAAKDEMRPEYNFDYSTAVRGKYFRRPSERGSNMRKVIVFNFVTLNGYFEGPKRDISWHKHGAEENEYAAKMLKSGNTLLFGRVTYEMMASYWPTPNAIKNDPIVAEGMNSAEKIVFSRTLKRVEWNNTRLLKDNIDEEIKKMKQLPGKDMTLLGSGSILTQFAEQGLIDEYQIMVDPVALGDDTPIFKNIKHKLDLELTRTRTFKSGVVLLCYQPVVKA